MAEASYQHLFAVPPGVVFLNAANVGPRLHACSEAGGAAMQRWASPWSLSPADWFHDVEQVRALAASFMNADADGVALVPSVSYGIAIAASNVSIARGQGIVALAEEFPSNYYYWQRAAQAKGAELITVPRPRHGTFAEAILQAIDDRTAVVTVPTCHWTDGMLVGIEQVAARVREVGASLVIDASQALGALPIDVKRLDPAFLVSVGYKWLLGPYGVSYLYVAPRHRSGAPIEETWMSRAGSDDFTRLVEYTDSYREGARRFDSGGISNFILLPIAIAALRQMKAWTPAGVARCLHRVTTVIAHRADELGFEPTPAAQRSSHFLGLRVGKDQAARIGSSLLSAGIHVSVRGDTIRIAPHMHTTDADVERLLASLATVGRPRKST